MVYGVDEFGLLKFLNFIIITIPISLIIIEKLSYQEIKSFFIILTWLAVILCFLP